MNDLPQISGKLSGAFMVLDETRQELLKKWEAGEELLSEGQITSYKEAKKEVESRLKDIFSIVAKFEKLIELRKTL